MQVVRQRRELIARHRKQLDKLLTARQELWVAQDNKAEVARLVAQKDRLTQELAALGPSVSRHASVAHRQLPLLSLPCAAPATHLCHYPHYLLSATISARSALISCSAPCIMAHWAGVAWHGVRQGAGLVAVGETRDIGAMLTLAARFVKQPPPQLHSDGWQRQANGASKPVTPLAPDSQRQQGRLLRANCLRFVQRCAELMATQRDHRLPSCKLLLAYDAAVMVAGGELLFGTVHYLDQRCAAVMI